MTKKHITLDELAQMVPRGFEATASKDALDGVRGKIRTLREELCDAARAVVSVAAALQGGDDIVALTTPHLPAESSRILDLGRSQA
jgi:hypothetical protein